MQLYDRGIRRRLAPMFDGDRRRLELAYSLLFTLPGTPVLRYGDELGMGEDLSLPERSCVAHAHAVVHRAERRLLHRADDPCCRWSSEGPFGYGQVNVADQKRDPTSLLNWTERIIRARKECPGDGLGDLERAADQLTERARPALRLAEQRGAVPPQLRPQGRYR